MTIDSSTVNVASGVLLGSPHPSLVLANSQRRWNNIFIQTIERAIHTKA